MREREKWEHAEQPQRSVTMVEIPRNRVQQVRQFIAGLEASDDVSAHMLRLGVAATRTELTNCHHTGEDNSDWSCADVTTW